MRDPGQDLVARMARRDEHAMGELYDRYADLLLALAYRILQDRAEAEDVVLECLERAWRDAASFDAGRGSVRTWLCVMVRSRSLDAVRARRRHTKAAERAARDASVDHVGAGMHDRTPAGAAERDDDRRVVRQALADLSDIQRQAIELAYYGGLSQSEIAARLDTPLGTIKTRMRDGMQKLREALKPLYAGAAR